MNLSQRLKYTLCFIKGTAWLGILSFHQPWLQSCKEVPGFKILMLPGEINDRLRVGDQVKSPVALVDSWLSKKY